MTQQDRFAERSRLIKVAALQTFFDDRHLRVLERQFPRGSRVETLLRLCQFPYKFGVCHIMADVAGMYAEGYHIAKFARAGFELLKVLYDISEKLDSGEISYLRHQVNACITDPRKDLAPILTEAQAYHSLHPVCDEITIGDGTERPDLAVVAGGGKYWLQCKSVRYGLHETAALRGFCSLLNGLSGEAAKLIRVGMHSAWEILDPLAFATAERVREAKQQIVGYLDAYIAGNFIFEHRTGVLGFLGDGSSRTIPLSRFSR